MSRREQLRANTRQEIKSIARQHMIEQGTAAISLNAIAKAMEISAPALYRYYDDRSALITDLIVDAYRAFADALETVSKANADLPIRDRLFETMLTYREWALAHPVDFQLIYGNPIPGYRAPFEQTAVEARRSFTIFLDLLVEAAKQGKLHTPPLENMGFGLAMPDLTPLPPDSGIPIGALYVGVVGWSRIHGLIMLEMFHHLQMINGDPGAFYRHEINTLLAEYVGAPTR